VVVSLVPDGNTAEIRVRDTGAGIDTALLPRIFEPFVQGDRTLARSEGGLGLGLSLVTGIAELHGGDVHAESGGVGKGTEFVVRLPTREASVVPARLGVRVHAAGSARRVLVVDDNEDAAESLADFLRMLGHGVDVAYDGPSALAKIGASAPDVVFCDIGLPGMSGYDIARAVRANGIDRVQLVAISGYVRAEDVKRALETGFDRHLAKPPDPDEIARVLA
jgi:CheY-like chemotaxis protein